MRCVLQMPVAKGSEVRIDLAKDQCLTVKVQSGAFTKPRGWIHSTVRPQVLEGSAEIAGWELVAGAEYSFSDIKFAIFTWHGCTLSIHISVQTAVVHASMHALPFMLELD